MGRRVLPTISSTGSVPTATGPTARTIPGWPDGRCRFDDIDPALLEQALVAATTRQDGQSMSAEVIRRRRTTLGAVLRSAVRRGHIEWRAPDRNLAVDGLTTSESRGRPIVEAVVQLARSFELKVVADGVEEADQAVRLVEHGIEPAQGWLWSPAVSANDAMELVRRLPLPMPSAPRGTATTTHPPVSARPVKSSIVR